MANRPWIIERAVELARSGSVGTMVELERALKSENYEGIREHLQGGATRQALSDAMRSARGLPPRPRWRSTTKPREIVR